LRELDYAAIEDRYHRVRLLTEFDGPA